MNNSANQYFDSLYLTNLKYIGIFAKFDLLFIRGSKNNNNQVEVRVYDKYEFDTTFIIKHGSHTSLNYKVCDSFYLPITLRFYKNNKLSFTSGLKKKVFVSKDLQVVDSFYIHSYIQNLPAIIKNNKKYELQEFFKINDFSIKIISIDINKSEIKFEYKNHKEKIIGNEEDYYLSDVLFDNIVTKTNRRNVKYYILHFYGKWCKPCMEEYHDVLDFSTKISNSNFAALIHIECKINNIKDVQDYIPIAAGHNIEEEIITKNKSGYIKFFNVWQYPKYVIITKEGKIVKNNIENITALKNVMNQL